MRTLRDSLKVIGKDMIEVSVIVRIKYFEKKKLDDLIQKIAFDLKSNNYEIVLVDDSIEQACSISREDVEIVKTGGNKGANDALELGSLTAKYQFCAIQDDDDRYVNGRILEQISRLVSTGMIYCVAPIVKVDSNGKEIPQPLGIIQYENYSTNWLLLGSYGGDASLVWDQDKSGPLVMPSKVANFGDWVWALENLWDTNTTYSSRTRYLYTQHSGQLTRNAEKSDTEFSVLHSVWSKRQKNLNLPILDISELRVVFKPYLAFKKKYRKSEVCRIWFRDFLHQMKQLDSCNKELEVVVHRKMEISSIPSGKTLWRSLKALLPLLRMKFILEVILAFRYMR